MVTVKQIAVNGKERVVQAVSVSFDPEQNEVIGHGVPEEGEVRYSSGHVYVMNENGKTVSSHNLWMRRKQ